MLDIYGMPANIAIIGRKHPQLNAMTLQLLLVHMDSFLIPLLRIPLVVRAIVGLAIPSAT